MRRACLFLIIPLLSGFTAIPPEVFTKVAVSSSSVNRITCPEPVRDVVYSKEKPVELKVNDRNLFIKFLLRKEGEKEAPPSQEVDMYIVCGDAVYNLLLVPGDLPAQTLTLANPSSNMKKNIAGWKGMSHEEKLIKLLRAAYTESFPDGFAVKDDNSDPAVDFPGSALVRRRLVTVEGEGLILTEYILTPDSAVEVRETDFLKLAERPLLIALDRNRINAKDSARLFIIESSLDPEVRK